MNAHRGAASRRQANGGEEPRKSGPRFWNAAAQAWMIAVLVAFLLIRVVESSGAHRLLLWWKAR